MAEGLPEEDNAIGDRRKTTETETRSSLSTVYACTGRLPPKFVSTNQIRPRALPARALPAGFCWVYKGRKVLRKPFGLGFGSGKVKVRRALT